MPTICFKSPNFASPQTSSGSNALKVFKRPPIFYVSRSKFAPQGSQKQSNVIPLISEPRSTASRYGKAVVENITINIDDQASIATVRFPKELHDFSSGNIVGDEIKIRLAQLEGFPSEVIFRGIVIQPTLELSPNADGVAYDCIGFRFLLNGEVIFGIRKFSDPNTHETFLPTIFNEDDRPDRSTTKKSVNGFLTFLFDKGNENAVFWRVSDIIEYIIAVEVKSKIATAMNFPKSGELGPLGFVPKHFELQNEQIAIAITRTIRQMGPAYHWWLDDFFSVQGGAQSNFKWFVIGGLDNTRAGQRIEDALATAIATGDAIPNRRDTRRAFSIGNLPDTIEDNPQFNVNSITINEDGSDVVNRLIIIGDFVQVETVFKLTKDWTDEEETDLKNLLPEKYPGITADAASPGDVAKFKTAERDAKLENVFRRWKLDAVDTKLIFDDIETQLDAKFDKPKDINGKDIDWFDRSALPPFERNLFTQQNTDDGKQDIRMQVYGYTDFRKKTKDFVADKETSSILIEDGFISWTLGTGRNSYVIDPKKPAIKFKRIIADEDFFTEGTIFVTAVLRTNVRIFHDTGKKGTARVTVTRIMEEERFKRVLRFKSLVPERQIEGTQPVSLKVPDQTTLPISFLDYSENENIFNETTEKEELKVVDKEGGYIIKSLAAEVVRDDLDELVDFAEDSVDILQRLAVETIIRIPYPSAGYSPGQLIKRVSNSGFKNFKDSTIIGVSINGVDFSTELTTTNKKT